MSVRMAEFIDHPSAWLGSELARDTSWVYRFSPTDLAELDAALRGVRRRGLAREQIGIEAFPLASLGPRLRAILTEIRVGRGFAVLRGLPVRDYSEEEAAIIYWGIGAHLGTPVKQNVAGDLLGQIRDFGKRWGDLGVRGYETSGHLIFHTDFSDMVGLLCLRKARQGGLSRIASSITVHNELLRHHPEHLPVLYRGFRYIKREAVESDSPVTGHVPVFGYHEGFLSCRVVRERIEAAARRMEQPLSPGESAALDCFAAIAGSERVFLDMDLLPGDMQFLNNYTILHSRTSFEDGETEEERRHLLRLWLTFREGRRPLPSHFPQANGYGLPGAPPPVGALELGLATA